MYSCNIIEVSSACYWVRNKLTLTPRIWLICRFFSNCRKKAMNALGASSCWSYCWLNDRRFLLRKFFHTKILMFNTNSILLNNSKNDNSFKILDGVQWIYVRNYSTIIKPRINHFWRLWIALKPISSFWDRE